MLFLGGRGWITRAALLKTARRAVFALSLATAPQLFESTLASPFSRQIKQKLQYPLDTGVLGGAKQPKSEPLPSGASLAAISSKVMVFVPSFVRINLWSTPSLCWVVRLSIISHSAVTMADLED